MKTLFLPKTNEITVGILTIILTVFGRNDLFMKSFLFLVSKEKRTEVDDIKLSSRSKYLHLKNYLYFRCEDCDYNTKNGQDFERHLLQHDEETQLDADATFCFEIEEKNDKTKEEKEKIEPFKLSSIIETNESQDLLEESSE